MRISLRPMVSLGLIAMAWAASLSSFFADLGFLIVSCIREAIVWAYDFIPRLVERAQPIRRILMAATALNGRHVGGVRVHGFLGRPAVRMLAG